MAAQKKREPIKVFRIGEVSASVFQNESGKGNEFLSVNLQRRYKKGDEWKTSSSFTGEGEITAAIEVLRQAKTFIEEQQAVPA